MKLKMLFFVFFIWSSSKIKAQSSLRDSLKSFTINIVNKAFQKGKIKKLAVWDFTDIKKEITPFGSYIAELFSIYAENVDTVQLMDRQNLRSLLNEHKLKSEGFIDQNTIMELGKFSDVEAVVVGSVIVVDNDFQILVKILSTNGAKSVAADEQYFPIDCKMASILGIECPSTGNKSNTNGSIDNSPNRGFNRPLNSNEQYNNSATVNQDCEKNNTGDYCFYNLSKKILEIFVFYPDTPGGYVSDNANSRFLLKPGESKCIYDIPVGSTGMKTRFHAEYLTEATNGNSSRYEAVDSGDFLVEKCKSKSYTIK